MIDDEELEEFLSIYTVLDNDGVPITAESEISDEDAMLIAKEMIENPDYSDLLKDEMSSYFTQFLESQWDIGVANRRKPKKEQEKKENNQKYNT